MRPFTLGPVELDLVALDGDLPSAGILRALAAQVDAGAVRVADLVVVSRDIGGEVSVAEVDLDEYGLAGVELLAPGLAGEEDIADLAAHIAPGHAAAVVVLKLVWARELAAQLAASGSTVMATERIPAPVVNALLDIAAD